MKFSGRWIWSDNRREINQFVEFRKNIALNSKIVRVYISVDSDYELWVNGYFLGWNQYPNWPKNKTYNCHDVSDSVKRGTNCIAIRCYFRGKNFAVYAKGNPGLLFSLLDEKGAVLLSSDSSWKCRRSKTYKSGLVPTVDFQVGFTAEYNAIEDDLWQSIDYDDSHWQKPMEISGPTDGYWQSVTPRPTKLLKLGPPKSADLIASGFIIRQKEHETFAKTMSHDAMISFPLDESLNYSGQVTASRIRTFPSGNDDAIIINNPSDNKGVYLIYDVGCEESGLLEIDIDADEGTILDIAHGEHLDDLRVRAELGGRNFADRYICKSGRQKWLFPYRRLGCRYLEVHIPQVTGKIRIYQITIRPTTYPIEKLGNYNCCDSKLNDIWKLSSRTLELCTHEHYEDCPWREQALYACDSRTQALFSYYAFGEYEFSAACFDLLGSGMSKDGLLELTAPGKIPVNIPSFSLYWIIGLWELFLYSGKAELVEKQFKKICIILDTALLRLTPEGVVANSTNLNHWHFYEWTQGLEGNISDAFDRKRQETSLDAVYNLLLIGALNAASKLGKYLKNVKLSGYLKRADEISKSFHPMFWDEEKQLYASFVIKNRKSNYAQLTQALAIIEGLVPNKKMARQLCVKLKEDENLALAELSSLNFVYKALLEHDKENISFVLDDIKNKFGGMICAGATSLWETVDGAEAFSRAGSLCHAWSSVFNYIAGAYILGIRPLEPGFKKFIIQPLSGKLPFAEGKIPTLLDPIEVKWIISEDKIQIKLRHNKSLKPDFRLPEGKKIELI